MTDYQFDIEQQIRRSKLIDYVVRFGGMSGQQAEAWLDENCPSWRCGIEPQANRIEVMSDDSDDN